MKHIQIAITLAGFAGATALLGCSINPELGTGLTKRSVVCVGDSITAGVIHPNSLPQSGYEHFLAKISPGLQIRNYGVPGATTAAILAKPSRDGDIVVIEAGTNDLTRFAITGGHGRFGENIALSNMHRLLSRYHNRHVLVMPIPPAFGKFGFSIDEPLRLDYNRRLRTIAVSLGASWVDPHLTRQDICIDGLHPALKGYEKMAVAIRRSLELEADAYPNRP